MNAGACHTDQNVTRRKISSRNNVLLVHDTNGKTSQIVLILRHQPRMFCRLTADQRTACLLAALRHTGHDRRNLLRIVLATGNIVKEKQRFAAGTCNIVHAHGNTVNTDRVMLVQ